MKLRGLATLHPSFLARDQIQFPIVVNDLMKSLTPPPEFYTPHASLEDLHNFRAKKFAFDIETPWGNHNEIICIGLCAEPYKAICVPFSGAYVSELKRIFRESQDIVGHNCIQFDLPILRGKGVCPAAHTKVWDTMLLHHLCFPQFGKKSSDDDEKTTGAGHSLEFVGTQFTSKGAWKHDKASLETYCCRDTDVTLQVFYDLLSIMKELKLISLYEDVCIPLANICYLMWKTGFKVDHKQIRYIREELGKEKEKYEKELPAFLRTQRVQVNRRSPAPLGTLGKSGKPVKFILTPEWEEVIPWRSTVQKHRYLYSGEPGCLNQEVVKDPKTRKITTGKIALDKIYSRTKNLSVRALKKLNQLDETLTTFAKEEMESIDRMFPHFNVHGTASGRLSSSDPNLQNIPEPARLLYVPSHAGWKIVDVDYSQIENRLTAFLAGDDARLERFRRDPKFSEHRYAASLFLGIDYGDVEKDNDKDAPYGKAKRIVHGSNYGMGHKKIADMYDMDLKETRQMQATWKAAIKRTTIWQNTTAEQAKRQGYLKNVFGRYRPFYTASAYTESLSFLPQSTAADIIFRAMIGMMYERIGLAEEKVARVVKIYKPIPEPARLLLQVHDSLVFECPTSQVDDLIAVVRMVMEQPWEQLNGIVIPISVKVGDSWGSGVDYDLEEV